MRIAQITDLHLRQHMPGTAGINRRRSRWMAELFEAALAQIAAAQPDLLAVTGDLLDVPGWLIDPPRGFEIDEPAFWQDAAEQDYRLLRRLLDGSGLRYMVLPGNHDLDAAMWRVFDPAANVVDAAGFRVVRFCDHEHAHHQPRRFNDQRRRWEAMLADADSPPQIHLQHYVVTPAMNAGYPHTYAEGETLLRDTMASGRVRLSLSGHYHLGTPLLPAGPATLTTCPAFCEAPYPWRLYELDAAGGEVAMTEQALGADRLPRRPVVFLDRDGVINDRASYRQGPEAMALLPGVGPAIRRLREAGYATVVITAQSAVGMGYVPEEVVMCVNDKMSRLLAAQGAELDAIYFSTAAGERAVLPRYMDPRESKPRPALLHRAAADLDLDLQEAWMVGDRLGDIETAHRADVRPILVCTGDGARSRAAASDRWPDLPVADDLPAAVEFVLAGRGPR